MQIVDWGRDGLEREREIERDRKREREGGVETNLVITL